MANGNEWREYAHKINCNNNKPNDEDVINTVLMADFFFVLMEFDTYNFWFSMCNKFA